MNLTLEMISVIMRGGLAAAWPGIEGEGWLDDDDDVRMGCVSRTGFGVVPTPARSFHFM